MRRPAPPASTTPTGRTMALIVVMLESLDAPLSRVLLFRSFIDNGPSRRVADVRSILDARFHLDSLGKGGLMPEGRSRGRRGHGAGGREIRQPQRALGGNEFPAGLPQDPEADVAIAEADRD